MPAAYTKDQLAERASKSYNRLQENLSAAMAHPLDRRLYDALNGEMHEWARSLWYTHDQVRLLEAQEKHL